MLLDGHGRVWGYCKDRHIERLATTHVIDRYRTALLQTSPCIQHACLYAGTGRGCKRFGLRTRMSSAQIRPSLPGNSRAQRSSKPSFFCASPTGVIISCQFFFAAVFFVIALQREKVYIIRLIFLLHHQPDKSMCSRTL